MNIFQWSQFFLCCSETEQSKLSFYILFSERCQIATLQNLEMGMGCHFQCIPSPSCPKTKLLELISGFLFTKRNVMSKFIIAQFIQLSNLNTTSYTQSLQLSIFYYLCKILSLCGSNRYCHLIISLELFFSGYLLQREVFVFHNENMSIISTLFYGSIYFKQTQQLQPIQIVSSALVF